jgi:hypothetical protein
MKKLLCSVAIGLAMMALGAGGAAAQTTTTDIGISSFTKSGSGTAAYQSGTWASKFPTSTSGNTGSGLTFGDWNQSNAVFIGLDSITISTDVALTDSSVVNTLLQLGITSSVDDTVTFENSLGATDTFTLVTGQTIRSDDPGSETLSGTPSDGSTGGSVTAVNWATGTGSYSGSRLDAQEFTLPTSWDGTTLTNVTVGNGSAGYYTFLSGLQVVTTPDSTGGSGTGDSGGGSGTDDSGGSVPEPMSISLLVAGLLGLVVARRSTV